MITRRGFVLGSAAALASPLAQPLGAPARGTLGIAYTSFVVRLQQARRAGNRRPAPAPALPAGAMVDLCRKFGGDGCQIDFAQVSSTEPADLKQLRDTLERQAMFLEFSINAKTLVDADALAHVARVCRELGVERLRVAINGRRYEEYQSRRAWLDFAEKWTRTLRAAAPEIAQHRLEVGIENHKDWLADELAGILRTIKCPYLGACVDFGNNLAMLEDPLALAETLAPFAITTHVKDMAVQKTEQGFLLSEVPLGEGILPLARIVETLRRAKPNIRFNLEMMTRDPLVVPYKEDRYWAVFAPRDAAKVAQFEQAVLARSSDQPLPVVSRLDDAAKLAAEDENLRRSIAYFREKLARPAGAPGSN